MLICLFIASGCYYDSRVEYLWQRMYDPQNLKYLPFGHLQKVCQSLIWHAKKWLFVASKEAWILPKENFHTGPLAPGYM